MAADAPLNPAPRPDDAKARRPRAAAPLRDATANTSGSQVPGQPPPGSSLSDQPTVAPRQAGQQSNAPSRSASPASEATLASQDHWYYASGKQKVGPLSWTQLWTEARAGRLPPRAMVLRGGTSKWISAATVPGLFPAGGPAPEHLPSTVGTAPSITQGAATGVTALPSSKDNLGHPVSEPAAVPGYDILGELGRGGMGVVYKARHRKLNRVVALKMILSGSYAGVAERTRFQAEAEAVARLQHPGIVQVYEVGEHQGRPFFSLEFCPGGSLDKKVAGTPLPPAEAARLVQQLARAMQVAHQHHVVHRDLKPANVLLAADGTPKVTDFGLAKKVDEAGQTQSGAVMGTPSYMAPEQAGGEAKRVGPVADVYALGAILYELLTGRPPFKADTQLHTLFQVLSADPVSPRHLQPGVSRDLETVCLKCLEKEPKKRYATAHELANDLGRFLRGEPVVARPVGRTGRLWRWAKRSPAVAALLSLTLLLLAAGTTISTLFALEADQLATREAGARKAADKEREKAEALAKKEVLARKAADEERRKAEGLAKKELLARMAADEERGKAVRLAAEREKALDRETEAQKQKLDAEARVKEFLESIVVPMPGQRNDGADDPQRTDRLKKALRTAEGLLKSPDPKEQAAGYMALGQVLNLQGRRSEGIVSYLKGLELYYPGTQTATLAKMVFEHPAFQQKDRKGKVGDAAKRPKVLTLKGHTAPVLRVAYSPDGKRVASASADGTVKVFDLEQLLAERPASEKK